MPDHLVTLPSETNFIKPQQAKPGRYLGWVKETNHRWVKAKNDWTKEYTGFTRKTVPLIYRDGKWKEPMGLGRAIEMDVCDIIKVQSGDWIIK